MCTNLVIVLTAQFFLKEFWTRLDSQSSGLLEVSVCIRGFGKFAKPAKEYLGVSEVKKMLYKLFTFSERYNFSFLN